MGHTSMFKDGRDRPQLCARESNRKANDTKKLTTSLGGGQLEGACDARVGSDPTAEHSIAELSTLGDPSVDGPRRHIEKLGQFVVGRAKQAVVVCLVSTGRDRNERGALRSEFSLAYRHRVLTTGRRYQVVCVIDFHDLSHRRIPAEDSTQTPPFSIRYTPSLLRPGVFRFRQGEFIAASGLYTDVPRWGRNPPSFPQTPRISSSVA